MLAATLPAEVRRGGLLGPRLTALVAYQEGACHMSVETIRRFFLDVLHLPIRHGQVVKTVQKASAAFEFLHQSIIARFTDQPIPPSYGYLDAALKANAVGIFRVAKDPKFIDLAERLGNKRLRRRGKGRKGKAGRGGQTVDPDTIRRTFV